LRREVQTLVFTPERLVVVKGGPAARRAYFDRVLARVSPARAQLAAEYGAAVAQRNASLRRIAAHVSDRDALGPWTERVVALGTELVAARVELIEILAGNVGDYAGELGLPDVKLTYEGEPPTMQELEGLIDRDLERGTTGRGPHLHDVVITSGARDLRSFGSQGEQRMAVLALLLAEADVIAERRQVPPLVLLDDVLSELDPDRRAALVQLLPQGQTVMSATTRDALPGEPAQVLAVAPGRVECV
jgi:DNA replication and repair protein RecF